MHPAGSRTPIVTGLIALLLFLSSTASAQTGTYIAGAGFADVRLFDGASSPTLFGEDISRDGTAAGGSLRVGTWVHPRWTLEVGADIASRTTASFEGPVIAIFPPVPRLELRSSTSFVSVTTMAGFHSPAGKRVRMGYLAGFSFVRATHKTEPFDALPFFTFGGEVGFSTGGPNGPFTSTSRSSLTLPSGALQ